MPLCCFMVGFLSGTAAKAVPTCFHGRLFVRDSREGRPYLLSWIPYLLLDAQNREIHFQGFIRCAALQDNMSFTDGHS